MGGTPPASTAARIDRLFVQWSRSDSPGCSLGVSRNGRVVFQRGYGMASFELGVPISPLHVFPAASISKQFTAMSILLLAQRGQLSLEDDVGRHIPEWTDHGTRITIRNLLNHTSGLRDAFLLEGLAPAIPTGWSEASSYRLGVEIAKYRGLRTVGHAGGDRGIASYVVRYPDQEFAVALLCNLDN